MDVEVGDLDSAQQHLETAAALADRAPMTESSYRWSVAMALLAQANGDAEGAVQFLNQAEQLYRPGFFPNVRPIAAMKARIGIAHGELSAAAEWARDRGVSANDDVGYLSEFDHLTLVRLLLAQHWTNQNSGLLLQAAGLLDRLAAAAETSGRAGSLLEIRLLRALTHDAQGHRPGALDTLAQAWAMAPEPEGYVRLVLDLGAPMTELLRAATHHGVAGHHPRRLLRLVASPSAAAADPGQRPAPSPVESLSDRELQVLRLLDSELTGPQIARQLFVSHNTVRTHTKHIFSKLDVSNRRAAVRRARERGLL
jgi:LuxR family maltose regulon positive regulatory protein